MMGARDPNRQPLLRSIRDCLPGWIRLVRCNACGHQGMLPAARLLKKHGELALVEFALVGLKCSECAEYGATMRMVRLCEPGCPRQRG